MSARRRSASARGRRRCSRSALFSAVRPPRRRLGFSATGSASSASALIGRRGVRGRRPSAAWRRLRRRRSHASPAARRRQPRRRCHSRRWSSRHCRRPPHGRDHRGGPAAAARGLLGVAVGGGAGWPDRRSARSLVDHAGLVGTLAGEDRVISSGRRSRRYPSIDSSEAIACRSASGLSERALRSSTDMGTPCGSSVGSGRVGPATGDCALQTSARSRRRGRSSGPVLGAHDMSCLSNRPICPSEIDSCRGRRLGAPARAVGCRPGQGAGSGPARRLAGARLGGVGPAVVRPGPAQRVRHLQPRIDVDRAVERAPAPAGTRARRPTSCSRSMCAPAPTPYATAASVPASRSRGPRAVRAPMKSLRDTASSTGRPIATSAGSSRSTSIVCAGVLEKSGPGSSSSCSNATPRAIASSIRASRNRLTSPAISPSRGAVVQPPLGLGDRVHHHQRGAGLRAHVGQLGITQPADVVDDRGAGGDRRGRHGGL